MRSDNKNSKLWGGRFREPPDPVLWSFTRSTADRRLLSFDIEGSKAHVAGLEVSGLLTHEEAKLLHQGLDQMGSEASTGSFAFQEGDEDVHSAVERRLEELVGEVSGKLPTGRSRNDQVATDLKLYLRAACGGRIGELRGLIGVLSTLAEKSDIIIPVFTHLQPAQAVPLAHHLLAYAWMLVRDIERFQGARERLGMSPLGAGAAGGSSLPLQPNIAAEKLGFETTFENSIDAVSSRDFAAEYAFCAAQALVHLSRLAEEIVLWSSEPFGWVELSDAHTTGSSLLPQKKNPDIAELVRGKSAGAIGQLTALLALQKGLPLSYNRDLQEDKEHVFALDDTLSSALKAMTGMLSGATFHPPELSASLCALDLAEALVERGVPLRQAHRAVGELVLSRSTDGKKLEGVTVTELKAAHPKFRAEDVKLLDPKLSVERRRSPGGGSWASVKAQLSLLGKRLVEVGT